MIATGSLAATLQAAQVYVGGHGDSAERFDELLVYVYGAAGLGAALVEAVAFGESV